MFFLMNIVGIVMLVPAIIVHHKLRQPTSFGLWGIKAISSAFSIVLLSVSLLLFFIGAIFSHRGLVVLGLIEALSFIVHIIFISSVHDIDDRGVRVRENISKVIRRIIPSFFQKIPSQEPNRIDVVFHTYASTRRDLLCDIWEPDHGVDRTGVAIIYLHGSAWTLFDKDYGTRPFFNHLVNQGHMVMDVAYRLFPETNMQGMLDDTRHAITWLKQHASRFQISSDKIVLCGGSAGGQIGLLAAYTADNQSLKTAGLETIDLEVNSVISLYGPVDLKDTYYHTAQHLASNSTSNKPKPQWLVDRMGDEYYRLGFDKVEEPGKLVPILGGTPEEVPEDYAMFSPINYLHQNAPPTCIISGTHDIIVSEDSIISLVEKLRLLNVSTTLFLVPEADHAFDLFLPKISPASRNLYREIDTFLNRLS